MNNTMKELYAVHWLDDCGISGETDAGVAGLFETHDKAYEYMVSMGLDQVFYAVDGEEDVLDFYDSDKQAGDYTKLELEELFREYLEDFNMDDTSIEWSNDECKYWIRIQSMIVQ